MADTTTHYGWTISSADGSDPIAQIGAIVNELGATADAQMFLANDAHLAADLPTVYPQGISLMGITGGGSGGWPESASAGTVLSIRRGDGTRTYQLYFVSGQTSSMKVLYRFGTSSGWLTDWLFMTSRNAPSAQASGAVTISGSSGIRSAVVMFPSGRFTTGPRVMVSNDSNNLGVQTNCAVTDVSATQATIWVNRNDSLGAPVGWLAVQGVES